MLRLLWCYAGSRGEQGKTIGKNAREKRVTRASSEGHTALAALMYPVALQAMTIEDWSEADAEG